MEIVHEIARWSHIGVGTMAFASLWAAAFTRKGGKFHRAAGRVYVWTMVIVLSTAAVLTLTTLTRGQWIGAVFLFYLLTITATSLWMGKRTLSFKGDMRGYTRGPFLLIGVLNIIAAAGAVAVGLIAKQYFIAGIAIIGFLIGFGAIRHVAQPAGASALLAEGTHRRHGWRRDRDACGVCERRTTAALPRARYDGDHGLAVACACGRWFRTRRVSGAALRRSRRTAA